MPPDEGRPFRETYWKIQLLLFLLNESAEHADLQVKPRRYYLISSMKTYRCSKASPWVLKSKQWLWVRPVDGGSMDGREDLVARIWDEQKQGCLEKKDCWWLLSETKKDIAAKYLFRRGWIPMLKMKVVGLLWWLPASATVWRGKTSSRTRLSWIFRLRTDTRRSCSRQCTIDATLLRSLLKKALGSRKKLDWNCTALNISLSSTCWWRSSWSTKELSTADT